MRQPTKRNRLDGEASPYLQQHADNPVNWQPWGDEAFERASEHGVPVFVSIGYSSCHWCHVMAEESFEDEGIAEVLNDGFVPVKVDREERPDVDSTFMTVSQLVTGGGGWPLSAWCTPEGKPFYVGTYFPPEPRRNQPGFRELCERIADSWADPEQREEMERRAEQWTASARDELESVPGADSADSAADASDAEPPGAALLDEAAAAAVRGYDDEYGGFGSGGAKFPMPGRIDLLMRAYARSGRDAALTAATGTLDGMARGGVYDQVGGGFHRYATDRRWTVPHFEKMLYDNAELPLVYLDGYRLTGDPTYARIASETLGFLDRELRHADGGFFSTLDARSAPPESRRGDASDNGSGRADVEGAFYVWTPDEVDTVLDEPAASLARDRYGIESGGNFERGTTVPTVAASVEGLADERGLASEAVRETLTEARVALFEARESRPRPARDEKVLAAWNGRAISAFANAGGALGEPYAAVAREALDFCRDRLYDEESGTLARRWLDGDVRGPGYLDDHAFLARGALDVYAATGDPEPLGFALELAETIVADFYDADDGTIYFTRDPDGERTDDSRADGDGEAQRASSSRTQSGDGALFARPQEFTDRSTPSSLGVAAETLALLDGFRSDREFAAVAETVVTTHTDRIRASPLEHVSLVRAAERVETGGIEATIAAEAVPDEWRETLGERYLPDALVAPRPPTEDGLDAWLDRLGMDEAPPVWAGRDAADGEPTAYVCEGRTCSPPETDLDAALTWLAERR